MNEKTIRLMQDLIIGCKIDEIKAKTALKFCKDAGLEFVDDGIRMQSLNMVAIEKPSITPIDIDNETNTN